MSNTISVRRRDTGIERQNMNRNLMPSAVSCGTQTSPVTMMEQPMHSSFSLFVIRTSMLAIKPFYTMSGLPRKATTSKGQQIFHLGTNGATRTKTTRADLVIQKVSFTSWIYIQEMEEAITIPVKLLDQILIATQPTIRTTVVQRGSIGWNKDQRCWSIHRSSVLDSSFIPPHPLLCQLSFLLEVLLFCILRNA